MNQQQSIDSLISSSVNQITTCIKSDLMTIPKNQPPSTTTSGCNNMMTKRRIHSNNNDVHDVHDNHNDLSSSTISDVQHPSLKRTRVDNSEISPPYLPQNTVSIVPPSDVGIQTYEVNDVLSGRGGGTNQHKGNCYFRSLIRQNREKYLRAKKNDKPGISMTIVQAIRQQNGRFLKKDDESGLWYEIGDASAREKTSQALRQRAPEFRRKLLERDFTTTRSFNHPQIFEAAAATAAAAAAQESISTTSNDLSSHLFGNLSSPMVPDVTLLHNTLNETLHQIQILEAQRTLQLQQKINSAKLLELMLKLQRSS